MIAIKGMTMPENCAYCPCLYTDYQGWQCGTKDMPRQSVFFAKTELVSFGRYR